MPRDATLFVRSLTVEERQMIQDLYHRTPDALLKSRCHILLLSADGHRVPQIAQLLYYSADTVARCIHDFNHQGLDGILPHPGGGRPPKVTADYLDRLFQAVDADPRELGQPFSVWTAPALAAYLTAQTGIAVDESRVRYYLHLAGYHLRRPVLSVSSPDPAYATKVARLADLQAQAQRGEIELYYADEVDLALLPTITRCWCKVGQQRRIDTPRQNEKRYGAGLTNWRTGEFYWAVSDHKDNTLFRAVLTQVVRPPQSSFPMAAPRKKYIVIDNYRIHYAKPVQELLAAYGDEVELVPLPTYSPKLNPVERLWKHLRQRVTHNHRFADVAALLAAVKQFFAELAVQPAIVRSVAGLAA